jgi:hypothetical protein
MERLERMEDSQRVEPLGRALNQLRARVEFSSDLETFLKVFIERRNTLAHRFNAIPEEQRIEFLTTLLIDSFKAIYAFHVLLHQLLQERDLARQIDERMKKILQFVQTAFPELKKDAAVFFATRVRRLDVLSERNIVRLSIKIRISLL